MKTKLAPRRRRPGARNPSMQWIASCKQVKHASMRLAKYAKVSLIKEMDTPELLPDIGHQWLAGSNASPLLTSLSAPAGPPVDEKMTTFLQYGPMSRAHRPPRTVHPRPHSHFTELENGTLDHLAQSQLVRASSSSSATSARGDIGELVRGVLDPPWAQFPFVNCRTWASDPLALVAGPTSLPFSRPQCSTVAQGGEALFPLNIRRPDLAEVH